MILVTGKMYLLHPFDRNRSQVFARIKFVVDATYVDVVDVEENETVGLFSHRAQKIPLRQA